MRQGQLVQRTTRLLLVSLVIASAIMFVGARPALAACHHFTVTASPNPVAEGQTLTVKVSRDGGLNPSHVDVSTVDETAKAGRDYVAVKRTMSFTTETEQSFPLSILDDKLTGEGAQTFRLHLSNPGGCAVNPNFVLDPDVKVTIADNDAAPPSSTTATSTGSSSSQVPTTGSATTASTTATATGSGASSSTAPTLAGGATPTTIKAATGPAGHKKGGRGAGGVIAAIAAVAALGVVGGGYARYRKRQS